MTTVANVKLSYTTYAEAFDAANGLRVTHEQMFHDLTGMIENATDKQSFGEYEQQAQVCVNHKQGDALSVLQNGVYPHFQRVLEVHAIAKDVLKNMREIDGFCQTGRIVLTPDQITHYTKNGMLQKMEESNNKHGDSFKELGDELLDLETLVQNTSKYIAKMELIGNKFAFAVEQLAGRASSAGWYTSGAGYYFRQGLEAYKNPPVLTSEKEMQDVTSANEANPAPAAVL